MMRLALAAYAACAGEPPRRDPEHQAAAALLFEYSLDLAPELPAAQADEATATALEGLLHTGEALASAGQARAALRAFDAALRATAPAPMAAPAPAHVLAMLRKLQVLQLRLHQMDLLAAAQGGQGEGEEQDEDQRFSARFSPRPYWLDWPVVWEEGRGPAQRASGCTDAQAEEALAMLEQLSADVEVRRLEDCFVGFHGVLLKRGGPSRLELLQLPSAPDSSAPLLTLWALGLIPPDFETEGATWPFRLPLAAGLEPEQFTPAAIARLSAEYAERQAEGEWRGFRASSRPELEALRLWQSADELRHVEGLMEGGDGCEGEPEVVEVERLVSLVGGYSLNYYHWLTELLPGLLRLLPTLQKDPALRVL